VETRARYVQVGAFTLAVILAGFVFVYWLNSATGLGSRSVYIVRFQGSVSGLLTGSAVLFNGVRVGEVTRLEVDAAYPRQVLATIAVDRATPVRQDTFVSIDFQGLTGSPVIALVGGGSTAPFPTTSGVPLLEADGTAGQSMSGAARDVLQRFDAILADNAKPLKSMIANLETFAGALARNSDKLDGIVAGLERMTGGAGKGRLAMYDLTIPSIALPHDKIPAAQLTVGEPTAFSVLDSDRIQSISETGAYTAFGDAQWGDLLPKLVQTSLARSLQDAGLSASVSRPVDGFAGDFQLVLDIRKFHLGLNQVGEVELGAKLLDGKGRSVASRVVRNSAPAQALTGPAVAAALNRAFASVATELATWTASAITELSQPKGVIPKKSTGD
jgi:phospholipid/cholesterol/gamma-HCH transport system substrate-binding protein